MFTVQRPSDKIHRSLGALTERTTVKDVKVEKRNDVSFFPWSAEKKSVMESRVERLSRRSLCEDSASTVALTLDTHDCCINRSGQICTKHNRPTAVVSLKFSCNSSFLSVLCFWSFNGLHVPYGAPEVHNQSDVIGCPCFFRCVKGFQAYYILLLALGQCFWYSLLFVKPTRDIFRTFWYNPFE